MKKIILNLPAKSLGDSTILNDGFFLYGDNLCYKSGNIDNFGTISSFFERTSEDTFKISWPSVKSSSITKEVWGFNNNDN